MGRILIGDWDTLESILDLNGGRFHNPEVCRYPEIHKCFSVLINLGDEMEYTASSARVLLAMGQSSH